MSYVYGATTARQRAATDRRARVAVPPPRPARAPRPPVDHQATRALIADAAEELDRFALECDRAEGLSALTPRQLDCIALAALGMTDERIGECLYITVNSVKTHLGYAFKVLEVHTRTAAVMRCLREQQITVPRHDLALVDRITDREAQVIALVAEGLKNHEIAERLGLSPMTIKSHLARISRRVGAKDRTALAVIAYQHGVVQ